LTEPIVMTRNLNHVYQPGPLQKVALADVSLEISRGSCVAIVGVTGSGKSTLIQHFNGLLRPTSGSVVVDGVCIGPHGADLVALRQRVGLLFQSPEAQLFRRTVFEDVAFGPERLGLPRREVRIRVAAALNAVGLPPSEFGQRSPFSLSGGQMRRAALAGVLALNPSVLVLDEPTLGLDAAGRAEFHAHVGRARRERGVTVILVTHDMAEVAALADQVFVLAGGRLVAQGTSRAIFARGDCLGQWGLAPPPLVELLGLLRERGMAIETDALTLDEAVARLQAAVAPRRSG
jgi:energy-coupling factor transport system ATP-binding protein